MNPDTTEFGKKLAANKHLADACSEFAHQLRAAAQTHADAVEASERMTREDLTVVINARSDQYLTIPD